MIFIKALPVYIIIGKILSITDVDIVYFHQTVLDFIMCRFKCDEGHWLDDEDEDGTWDEAHEDEYVGDNMEGDDDYDYDDFFFGDGDSEDEDEEEGNAEPLVDERRRSRTRGWSILG